jgi:hypothetical protein
MSQQTLGSVCHLFQETRDVYVHVIVYVLGRKENLLERVSPESLLISSN